MDFDLTEDQQDVKRVARELLSDRSPLQNVRAAAHAGAYDESLRKELVELGWAGIAVAEEHGGQGLGTVELAVLAEQLGYACASTPLLPSAAAAAAIEAAGTPEQQAAWLPGLVRGELTAGIGERALMVDAAGSDLAVALDGDDARLIASPRCRPFDAIDPTRRYARLETGGGEQPLGAGAADRIRIVLAAEILGVCQRALEMTVAYVKDRKQFGVAVGSFQAVSHRCAEMLRHTESVRSVAYFAAWVADAEPERLPEAAALTAAAAAEAGREVTASAIQAHGGIGFTWEADVHWLYKRAQLDVMLLGGARRHRAALARHVTSRRRPVSTS
jgi:alkylation response protein AidB-like acyl-CoA dehydrogenase